MKREQKLKLLKAVIEGKLSKEALAPPRTFFFIQNERGYSMDGVQYSEKEVREFETKIEVKNKIIEEAGKDLPKDLVIIVEFVKGKTIL
jgi:hypothetical protein